MNKINQSISVVIPVYNSENTIGKLIEKLQNTLSAFVDYSIILVDDCSTDKSYETIKSYALKHSNITAIMLGKNVGQQKATFLGLKHAAGDYVVIIDDDLAHDPNDIMLLYDKIQQGYDVVYCICNNDAQKSLLRNLGSRVRDFTFNHITHKPKDIKVSSYRIINKDTHRKILNADTEFIYISMEILKYTSNIGNIYVEYQSGTPSNYTLSKLIALIKNMYIYYSKQRFFNVKPLHKDTYKILDIINGETL